MESLTRNNYEIWFLDYLDGQLSNEQLETFLDFLEQNPDLKQELLGVSGVSLAAGVESLDQKEQLLKSPADIPGIASMDQLCIARMENDLPEEEARMFDFQLNEYAELAEKYAAFQLTRLNPADSVIYPYKKELLRKTRILSPWIITAISSAAVILLVWFLWPDPPKIVTPGLAKIEQTATSNQLPSTNIQQPITDNRQPTTIIPVNEKPAKLESSPREFIPMNSLSHKSAGAGPRIPDPQSTKILLASNYPSAIINSVTAADALTLPQYALQLFREKILGEDRILVRRTRFSMWEVAGAGVDKINSLAGTNMKFNREYDSKGDIMAVSFNSRLFDVESPIRDQENR
ncbi:MAG: hypothetical protein D4R64_08865 [Porphyromonadaceae bacterium]|nr:MAG: hypothetical protein D4R64_08865 [Porphyromonadaceae bacterium]